MVKIIGKEQKQIDASKNSGVKSLKFCDHDPVDEKGDKHSIRKEKVKYRKPITGNCGP